MSIDFFKYTTNLKNILRQGWINKLNLQRPESVADHSYSVTIMAMVFSDLLKLDTEKILKMSLLHDLAESKIGDITPERMPKDDKLKIENNAMKEILNELDNDMSKKYFSIWEEYLNENTRESKLLHQIDKLEMALQARIYENTSSKEKISDFMDSAKLKLTDKQLIDLLEQIINHNDFQVKDVGRK